MRGCRFDAVIHFAGRKAVGESVQEPWLYYDHNVLGAINLIEVMWEHNVKNVSMPALLILVQRSILCAAALSTPSSYILICLRLYLPPCSSHLAEDCYLNDRVQLCV